MAQEKDLGIVACGKCLYGGNVVRLRLLGKDMVDNKARIISDLYVCPVCILDQPHAVIAVNVRTLRADVRKEGKLYRVDFRRRNQSEQENEAEQEECITLNEEELAAISAQAEGDADAECPSEEDHD